MNDRDFEKALRRAFDDKIRVDRDRRDHCLVVWDKTRRGVPYPAYKVAKEHNQPGVRGTPREAFETDVHNLRRMDWARRYNARGGAGREVFRERYLDPEDRRTEEREVRVEETVRGPVRDYAEWYTGARTLHGPGGGGLKSVRGRQSDSTGKSEERWRRRAEERGVPFVRVDE